MQKLISEAEALFCNKIKLLVVEDDEFMCKSLRDIFLSPLFYVSTASSFEEASDVIGNSPDQWHCWIVDINLGKRKTGIDLLKVYPNFQFSIFLSALHSMTKASEAMHQGARTVLDKIPNDFSILFNEVNKLAAIGFLLNGSFTSQLEVFLLLQETTTNSIEEWARKACMDIRKLQRLCEPYNITPRYALSLYKTIYFLLWQRTAIPPNAKFEFGPRLDQMDFYEKCIEYLMRKEKK
jgi:ActR/RegA family two-component response regulator